MANPAPTINQINAFNATQGTTIDFNIIGGTELVRSNRIYIYDLSDNSLICTHLYVSTESIHELPANTDGSILYADGKSSADFVNGAQYYAQIQTFTDIAGTEGGSGLSVAKMFWCLVDPTLTIDAIPSTISTTSYNVSATYNANTSVVSNIIQQYQFSLYSATGSLLQSSGVVVGSGTQQGTSTAYDISYNFTGLSVGSSYYVTVEVTTTQGMSVSAQSNTFTVSIDTPTLGEATVVNNACDGYISVTSNLSGEYGGSGSGEIVSFETDSENVFTKLQVDLEPIQDLHGYDAPWVGGAGKNLLSVPMSQGGSNTLITQLPNFKSGEYTFSFSGTLQATWQVTARKIVDGTRTQIKAQYNTYSITFTLDEDATLELEIYRSGILLSSINNIQIEKGSTATSYAPYENICPISGHTEVDVVRTGKNLNPNEGVNYSTWTSERFFLKAGQYVLSTDNGEVVGQNNAIYIQLQNEAGNVITKGGITSSWFTLNGSETFYYGGVNAPSRAFVLNFDAYMLIGFNNQKPTNFNALQLELGTTATDYEPYNGTTYTTTLPSTTYGGTLDVVSGLLTVDRAIITFNGSESWGTGSAGGGTTFISPILPSVGLNDTTHKQLYNMAEWVQYADRNGMLLNPSNNKIYVGSALTASAFNSDLATFKTYLGNNPLQVCYYLATPQTYQLTPQQIQTLLGQNNVWSDAGEVEVTYNIPITNLLVKRQDVADVSGDWLTLYSQPITQASDMDFTFIDFTNQYGKTYKYALVPLLTQTQSGVEVEVEGGYTVSDEVQSVFDGVFIVDSTGSQKCKANVGYGNVDMNQTVGTITPIGAKYPVVITNSKNQYHNGSISGTIVPDDYYFNGNLSRIDMVNKRDELEQFLTNKRAKIIKDWNGKIWLVMIMDNVSCTFNNNYGMGIVNFSTNWVEVGDPTNQQDLQATGLIDVGGA